MKQRNEFPASATPDDLGRLLKPKRFIRIAEVVAKTTLSQSTIYKGIREGTFPRAHRIGGQAVAWLESDVDEWMDSQPEADPADWHTPKRRELATIRAVK